MSRNISQTQKKLPGQDDDLEGLESRLDTLRQQVGDLQRDLAYLEEHVRILKHQKVQVTPALPSAPHVSTAVPSQRVGWQVVIAVILSLVLVYGGQFVLIKTNRGASNEGLRQILAGSMLISGALVFGGFTRRLASTDRPRLEFPVEQVDSTPSFWRDGWSLGWLAASIVVATLVLVLFVTFRENLMLVLLWLVSILALGISQARHVRLPRPFLRPEERKYLAGLAVLLLIALVTRLYHLTTLPYNFDGDYASVGLEARAMLNGERQVFSYGWASIPMLGYAPAWLSMSLFGNNLAGLNASGVIEGLLVIIGVYLLGRDLFHARVGLLAAALLTISYAHLAASRQSVYIDPVFFLVFAIYFLFVGLREGHGLAIVISGLLTAFCALVYYPSRIIVFIVGAMLLYLLLFRRKWLWARWWAIALWVLAVLVTLGPMIIVFVQGFDAFMSRTREVFILSPDIVRHMEGVYHVDTIPAMLLEQVHRSVLIFHYYTDTSTQFGFARPFLDAFTAPLFTLGLGYALFRWRQFGHALVLTWTGLGVLIGCFLTSNPPFWARLMILLPPTMLLAALALDFIYELANHGLAGIDSRMTLLAPAVTVLCLVVVGVLNWNTYVELKGSYATARTLIARYLEAQLPSARAYMISKDFNYNDREFAFLVPGRLVASLTPEQVESNLPPAGQPTLVILTPEQTAALSRLQQLFPNGAVEAHTGNSPNEVAFFAFRLP